MSAQLGDCVLYKGEGLTFTILSFLLSIVDSSWRRRKWRPWHTSFISDIREFDGAIFVTEATGDGVKENLLDEGQDIKIVRWLKKPPPYHLIRNFVNAHLGCKYDIAIYFWTSAAILFRHFWNRPIPKLLDSRFSCWELLAEFYADMGKPITSKYDVIVLTDILKALNL